MSQFLKVLFYLGALQGFLLSGFLFTVKTNTISNRLLGILTLFWGIVLLQVPLQSEGLYSTYPHLLKTISNLLFAFFPLLFLHVKYLLSGYKKFNFRDLVHFTPLLINVLLHSSFYLLSGAEKIDIIRNENIYYRTINIIGDEVIAIQGIAYSLLILKRLARYSKEIQNVHSTVNKSMLKVLLIGTSLTLFAWMIGAIGVNLDYFNVKVKVDLFVYVYLTLVVVIYFISYMSLKNPEMFKLEVEIQPQARIEAEVTGIHIEAQKSPEEFEQNHAETQEQLKLLQDFMEKEKPYVNFDLSLQGLADKLHLSRHQLSNLINQQHHKNFYEFVNFYRVEEVKYLMRQPKNQHLKLISLAYDAGFNSKSSFNRIFKQLTEMTPSQYFASLKEG